MQVLFGEWKGRRLKSPPDESVRPTTSRMRDWLCNVLADRFRGARVLDLFAGCGTLGIQALSLGAREALFVEQAARTQRILKANLELVGARERGRVVGTDVFRFLSRPGSERWDMIFVDPPYARMDYPKLMSALAAADILEMGGLMIVEHPGPQAVDTKGLEVVRSKAFGRSTISLLVAGEDNDRP
jgi:16S rRNA (guanine966-N2)-methyltransferase